MLQPSMEFLMAPHSSWDSQQVVDDKRIVYTREFYIHKYYIQKAGLKDVNGAYLSTSW